MLLRRRHLGCGESRVADALGWRRLPLDPRARLAAPGTQHEAKRSEASGSEYLSYPSVRSPNRLPTIILIHAVAPGLSR